MSTHVGDVLTSTDPEFPPVKIVAADVASGRWGATELDEFATPHWLDEREVRAYNIEDKPEQPEEQRGWAALRDAHDAARMKGRRILADVPKSPEDHFRDGTGVPVRVPEGHEVSERQEWPTIAFSEDEARMLRARR